MLRILDSFDHYATADLLAEAKWQLYTAGAGGSFYTMAIDPTGGRHGGGALHLTATFQDATAPLRKNFAPEPGDGTITSACIVGFAFKAEGAGAFVSNFDGASYYPDAPPGSLPPQPRNTLLSVRSQDNGGVLYGMVSYSIEKNGCIYVWRGDRSTTLPDAGFVFLGRTDRALKPGKWYYIEIKTVVDNTSGVVEIHVDGEVWLSLTGQDTYLQPDGLPHVGWCEVALFHLTAGSSSFGASAGTHEWYIDDVYVADGDTSSTNDVADFWGDHHMQVRQVTADGALIQMVPSSGVNHENVDDSTPDGDATYNEAVNALDADLFVCEDAVGGAGATIDAMQVVAHVKPGITGAAEASSVLRSAGVNYAGGTFLIVGSNYRFTRHVWTRDPADNGVISGADFNAFQIGVIRGA